MKLPQVRLELLRLLLAADVLLMTLLKGLVCVLPIPGISDLGPARILARTTYAEERKFDIKTPE